ncbi:MAG: hypothetical protein R3233_01015 [Xanthomonadales bacterium]|nr:hypothetical protein [Xanthomonadales bacterium]
MACSMTLTLVSETQKGDIGNDWKYTLEAKLYSGALTGQGSVSVPKHTLDSGEQREPPGPPEPLVIEAGPPGGESRVELRLVATEVDLLRNDSGEAATSLTMRCPNAGEPPVVEEHEISVGVSEAPAYTKSAVLKIRVRLEIAAA